MLLHQFDDSDGTAFGGACEGDGKAWEACPQIWDPCPQSCGNSGPCWCAEMSDRIASTIVSRSTPARFDGAMPLFSSAKGGFVVAPAIAQVLCSMADYGGSMGKTCRPRGVSAECVPGCQRRRKESDWCDHANPEQGRAADQGGKCSYRPTELDKMLRWQVATLDSSAARACVPTPVRVV